ncbi:MAG TPA: 30S ribosomal protein S6 [Candidatus Limnocylindria bacterium]|nr:30S ribosomal protein S6 [Candidatus Limnocylindria bacterium]
MMLVLRPDAPDDQVQAVIDRVTRSIAAAEGQIVKVSPWGRRRLAYAIGQQREGSYFIIQFDAPGAAVLELERFLNITEEVMRHLITRVEKPQSRRASADAGDGLADEEFAAPPTDDEDDIPDTEFIDESESEAAPAATDR